MNNIVFDIYLTVVKNRLKLSFRRLFSLFISREITAVCDELRLMLTGVTITSFVELRTFIRILQRFSHLEQKHRRG